MPLPSSSDDGKRAHVLWITWERSCTIRTSASCMATKDTTSCYDFAGRPHETLIVGRSRTRPSRTSGNKDIVRRPLLPLSLSRSLSLFNVGLYSIRKVHLVNWRGGGEPLGTQNV